MISLAAVTTAWVSGLAGVSRSPAIWPCDSPARHAGGEAGTVEDEAVGHVEEGEGVGARAVAGDGGGLPGVGRLQAGDTAPRSDSSEL